MLTISLMMLTEAGKFCNIEMLFIDCRLCVCGVCGHRLHITQKLSRFTFLQSLSVVANYRKGQAEYFNTLLVCCDGTNIDSHIHTETLRSPHHAKRNSNVQCQLKNFMFK
jgi:hypothetical protein